VKEDDVVVAVAGKEDECRRRKTFAIAVAVARCIREKEMREISTK
jgi:hypothetical protein